MEYTYNQFTEDLKKSKDIDFFYNGEKYSIRSYIMGKRIGIFLVRVRDHVCQKFDSFRELLMKARIEEKSIQEILPYTNFNLGKESYKRKYTLPLSSDHLWEKMGYTYEELMEFLSMGEEGDFYYNGEKYSFSCNKDGYYLSRYRDGAEQAFVSYAALLKNSKVEGKTIEEIWPFTDWNIDKDAYVKKYPIKEDVECLWIKP